MNVDESPIEDQSSENNDLSLDGDPVYTSSGKFSGGYTLDSGDYLYNATLLDSPPQNFSIAIWFSPNDTFDSSDSTDQFLITKTNVSYEDRFNIRLSAATGGVNVFGEANNAGNFTELNTSQTSWTGGTFYHAAFVWDDSGGNVYLYINGSEEDSSAYTTQLGSGTHDDFYIGARLGISSFRGTLDEGIVIGTALSSTDINDIMDNGLVQAGAAARRIFTVF